MCQACVPHERSPCLLGLCVQALCRAAGEVVDATLKAVNKDPEDDPPLDVVAGLYCDRTAGGERVVCLGGGDGGSPRWSPQITGSELEARLPARDGLPPPLKEPSGEPAKKWADLQLALLTWGLACHACLPAGREWALDTEFEAATQQVQRGFLAMLALDALLAFMASVEKLSDWAVDQGGEVPASAAKGMRSGASCGCRAAGDACSTALHHHLWMTPT